MHSPRAFAPAAVSTAGDAIRRYNHNARPDECDVGFDPRVTDVNRNLIPDECEPNVVVPPAAAGATSLDPSAVAAAINQWWDSFDYQGLKAWQVGYELKTKFAELGFDLRTTLADGGNQP